VAQYPIPQFIESEGRIISFLTFRQFFILVGAGVICFILYYILPFFLFAVIAVVIGLLAAAIAFLKIDDTSIVTLLLNFALFSMRSKSYIWKRSDAPFPFKNTNDEDVKNIREFTASEQNASRLDNLKKIVELSKKK